MLVFLLRNKRRLMDFYDFWKMYLIFFHGQWGPNSWNIHQNIFFYIPQKKERIWSDMRVSKLCKNSHSKTKKTCNFYNTDIYTWQKADYHCNLWIIVDHTQQVCTFWRERNRCAEKPSSPSSSSSLSFSLYFSCCSRSPSFFFSTHLSTSLRPNQFSFERSKVSKGVGHRFTNTHTHTISLLLGLSGTFTFSWFCAFCCTL